MNELISQQFCTDAFLKMQFSNMFIIQKKNRIHKNTKEGTGLMGLLFYISYFY